MLTEIESDLVQAIRSSPLGERVRTVAPLPEIDGRALVGRFGVEAPAIFVVVDGGELHGEELTLNIHLLCVARNARGHRAARGGDGVTVGLYQMIDALLLLPLPGQVRSFDLVDDEAMFQAGLHLARALLTIRHPVPGPDLSGLDDFLTFSGDLDIPPHETGEEHQQWLQEPPDLADSRPDATVRVDLP